MSISKGTERASESGSLDQVVKQVFEKNQNIHLGSKSVCALIVFLAFDQ